jgi:hypothetical protein
MATLYRTDGRMEELQPANGVNWSLEELQTLVGGYIEVTRTVDGRFLVLDEEGKLKRKDLNIFATRLYVYGRHDPIVGDAVVIDTRLEINGPDEEEESSCPTMGSGGVHTDSYYDDGICQTCGAKKKLPIAAEEEDDG